MFVAKTIDELGRSQNFLHKDFAVLYRTNASPVLLRKPCSSQISLIQWSEEPSSTAVREIRDIIAYLNLIANLVTISALNVLSTNRSVELGQVQLRENP